MHADSSETPETLTFRTTETDGLPGSHLRWAYEQMFGEPDKNPSQTAENLGKAARRAKDVCRRVQVGHRHARSRGWAHARDRQVARLVDEVLFEHHFATRPNFGWGGTGGKSTVDDALQLMSELRAAGVRSHFWIC